jgi:hypothetical protein
MDYKQNIQNIGKYHYLIANSSKSILLSSNNSKNEARQNALQKIKPIINNVLGKYIYLLTIRKISKKDLKNQENTTLKVLGGPVEVTIEKVLVVNDNKLKNERGFGNNRVYFSEKYLHTKSINDDNLKKIAFDYHNEKLKTGPFDVNILE